MSTTSFDTPLEPQGPKPGARVQFSGGALWSNSYYWTGIYTLGLNYSPIMIPFVIPEEKQDYSYADSWRKTQDILALQNGVPKPQEKYDAWYGGIDPATRLRHWDILGHGDYPDAYDSNTILNSIMGGVGSVAIERGTTIRFYKEKDFKGGIVLELTGPVLLNNITAAGHFGAAKELNVSPWMNQWNPETLIDDGTKIGDAFPLEGHIHMKQGYAGVLEGVRTLPSVEQGTWAHCLGFSGESPDSHETKSQPHSYVKNGIPYRTYVTLTEGSFKIRATSSTTGTLRSQPCNRTSSDAPDPGKIITSCKTVVWDIKGNNEVQDDWYKIKEDISDPKAGDVWDWGETGNSHYKARVESSSTGRRSGHPKTPIWDTVSDDTDKVLGNLEFYAGSYSGAIRDDNYIHVIFWATVEITAPKDNLYNKEVEMILAFGGKPGTKSFWSLHEKGIEFIPGPVGWATKSTDNKTHTNAVPTVYIGFTNAGNTKSWFPKKLSKQISSPGGWNPGSKHGPSATQGFRPPVTRNLNYSECYCWYGTDHTLSLRLGMPGERGTINGTTYSNGTNKFLWSEFLGDDFILHNLKDMSWPNKASGFGWAFNTGIRDVRNNPTLHLDGKSLGSPGGKGVTPNPGTGGGLG